MPRFDWLKQWFHGRTHHVEKPRESVSPSVLKAIWNVRDLVVDFGEQHPSVKETQKGEDLILLGSALPALLQGENGPVTRKAQQVFRKHMGRDLNLEKDQLNAVLDLVYELMLQPERT